MFSYLFAGLSLAYFVNATFPPYDPTFPNTGLPGDGDPTEGNYMFVTGVTYEGFTSATPGINATTLKACLDHAAGSKQEFNMFIWDNQTSQCNPIDTVKTIPDIKELKFSRIVIRVPLAKGYKEFNHEIFYFPATQKTKTTNFTKKSVKGRGPFNDFMNGCDVGLQNWVTIDGKSDWGWTQITYPRKASSVLIFSTIKAPKRRKKCLWINFVCNWSTVVND